MVNISMEPFDGLLIGCVGHALRGAFRTEKALETIFTCVQATLGQSQQEKTSELFQKLSRSPTSSHLQHESLSSFLCTTSSTETQWIKLSSESFCSRKVIVSACTE